MNDFPLVTIIDSNEVAIDLPRWIQHHVDDSSIDESTRWIRFQSRAWSVARPRAPVANDVYPGTKHIGASVSSLYLLEKMENNTNLSNVFWD